MSVARNLISPALLHLSCRCSSASSSSSGSSGSSSTPSSPSIRNASAQASISRRDAVKAVIKKVEESKEVGPFFDTFGRVHNYLRLSLTEKCSLRCVYCMPEEGIDLTPRSQLLTTDEIIKLVEVFAKNGIDKVRLTGGEPTNRKDLETIVERINGVKGINSIGITSNGVILHRNLENLKKAGLTKVNISLDTLDPAKYLLMTRRKVLPSVLKSIAKAEELYPMVKLNNVVMRNWNENEILHFIELTKERRLDVRFIEYMPFGGNDFSSKKFVGYAEMMKKIKGVYGEDVIRLQDSAHDTTKAWKIKGYTGQFGFITSMSEHFCDTCNRLRITADGNLKVCLHGNAEVSMRDLLRQGASDEEIQDVVRAAVLRKKKQHAGMENLKNMPNRPMILIGG